jgi:RNA polymerase sigma-70 factor, ECF subfamily
VNCKRIDVSDAELAIALTEGRPEAFRTAWERFSPLVGAVLRHALGSDELDDVRQEVFACLFRRVPTLRDPLALRPFVLAITFNSIKYERRRRRRRARVGLVPDTEQLNLAGCEQPASNLAFDRFGGLVRKLGKREQATFVYRFIEGMTVSQIATAMKISQPTVRRSFSRAWARVQKWAARDAFLIDYLHDNRLSSPAEDASRDDETTECAAQNEASSATVSGYPPAREPAVHQSHERRPIRRAA